MDEKKKNELKDKANKAVEKLNMTSKQKNKVVKLLIILLLIVFITNPARIPFLPQSWKDALVKAVSSLFKNITHISDVIRFSWVSLFQLVVMILALMLCFEVVKIVLNSLKPKNRRVQTLIHILLSCLNYLVVICGIFWGLAILGVDVATLFAGLGIFALVIGFGAESLVADLVTGFFMLFENEYNVGDIIEVDGFRGSVSSMGIRTTSVTDAGGNIRIINNSDLRNIINLSDHSSLAICDFPIPYEVKIADAEKALDQVLTRLTEEHKDIFAKKPTYLGVQELGESAVLLRISAEVKEEDRFKAARLLNRELKEGMELLGISCPYNQLVVRKEN